MPPRRKARERNAHLFSVLREVYLNPEDPDVRERWVLAVTDLVRTVFLTQFVSMRNSPEREDFEQSAILALHRIAPRLSVLTETYEPDSVFRVLYSATKFAMLRELAKLRRWLPPTKDGQAAGFVDIDTLIALEDEEDTGVSCAGPDAEVEAALTERFVEVHLPVAFALAVDHHNRHANEPWGNAIRFCALQRIQGRWISPTLVRLVWNPPDVAAVLVYSDFVARAAILHVANGNYRSHVEVP